MSTFIQEHPTSPMKLPTTACHVLRACQRVAVRKMESVCLCCGRWRLWRVLAFWATYMRNMAGPSEVSGVTGGV